MTLYVLGLFNAPLRRVRGIVITSCIEGPTLNAIVIKVASDESENDLIVAEYAPMVISH